MLKECAEELGIPATVVKKEFFERTVSKTDLHVLAVLTKLTELDNYQATYTVKGKNKWVEPQMTRFYIGYYDGAIKFIDNEACGLQTFTAEELEEEVKESPQLFTEDMKYIIKKFKHILKPAPKKVMHVLND